MRALHASKSTAAVAISVLVGLEVISPAVVDGPDSGVFITRVDLLNLRQAVLLHKERHGSLPDTLGQLIPEFWQRLPKDRWGAAYAYCPDDKGFEFLLYSTGRDGKDQAGAGDDIVPWEKDSDCSVYKANCLGERITELVRLVAMVAFPLAVLASAGIFIAARWRRLHASRAT